MGCPQVGEPRGSRWQLCPTFLSQDNFYLFIESGNIIYIYIYYTYIYMYTYKLFILDWDTADEQRHDSFRGTAKRRPHVHFLRLAC